MRREAGSGWDNGGTGRQSGGSVGELLLYPNLHKCFVMLSLSMGRSAILECSLAWRGRVLESGVLQPVGPESGTDVIAKTL